MQDGKWRATGGGFVVECVRTETKFEKLPNAMEILFTCDPCPPARGPLTSRHETLKLPVQYVLW